MITYIPIPTQTVELWNKDGFFARVNEHELNCIRVQIKNEEAEGFYIIYEGENINIDKRGRLQSWPKGLFDLIEFYLSQL